MRQKCADAKAEGEDLLEWARNHEAKTLRILGLVYYPHEPCFAEWSHDRISGFYHHPRDVAIELDRLDQELNNAARLQKECNSAQEESAARILDQVAGRA